MAWICQRFAAPARAPVARPGNCFAGNKCETEKPREVPESQALRGVRPALPRFPNHPRNARDFRESGGVISAAATRLGMPRTTLNAMMKKLGISRDDL